MFCIFVPPRFVFPHILTFLTFLYSFERTFLHFLLLNATTLATSSNVSVPWGLGWECWWEGLEAELRSQELSSQTRLPAGFRLQLLAPQLSLQTSPTTSPPKPLRYGNVTTLHQGDGRARARPVASSLT